MFRFVNGAFTVLSTVFFPAPSPHRRRSTHGVQWAMLPRLLAKAIEAELRATQRVERHVEVLNKEAGENKWKKNEI